MGDLEIEVKVAENYFEPNAVAIKRQKRHCIVKYYKTIYSYKSSARIREK